MYLFVYKIDSALAIAALVAGVWVWGFIRCVQTPWLRGVGVLQAFKSSVSISLTMWVLSLAMGALIVLHALEEVRDLNTWSLIGMGLYYACIVVLLLISTFIFKRMFQYQWLTTLMLSSGFTIMVVLIDRLLQQFCPSLSYSLLNISFLHAVK